MINFMEGSLFTLFLLSLCLLMAFRISEYREDTEIRKERKKNVQQEIPFQENDEGGVVKPLRPEQRALKKDETAQAFIDLLNEK